MNTNLTKTERKAINALASIISLRMLGLFMILPVFSLYAEHLDHVTPFLVGVAIGIYGLTQALFQIPFGLLSDRVGRKPIITIGLIIFAIGSVIAAMSDSIYGVILGRALQGSGAITAALMAFTADLTREEHRTKAMATIGATIGMSFVFSFVLGPVLNTWIGVQGIFWVIAVLAIVGIFILHVVVPQAHSCRFHRDTEPVPAQFKDILANMELMRLNIGILILHSILTSLFIVLPFVIHKMTTQHWQIYLPVIILAILTMIPLIIYAEKYRHLKLVFVGAVITLGLSQLGLGYFHSEFTLLVIFLYLFFVAFNVLEASLPSLVSKIAPPQNKGTAMGVYSSSQFMGAFFGGIAGGWLYHHYDIQAVFLFSGFLTLIWMGLAWTMQQPSYLASHMLNVGEVNQHQAQQLTQKLMQIPGVAEVVVFIEDGVAYLKVDKKAVDFTMLEEFSVPEQA